jgi:integrase
MPLDLRLAAIDLSLDEVTRRCRDNLVSRFLVHLRKRGNKAKRGDPLHADTITKGFMAARNRTALLWEPKVDKAGKEIPVTPPTFHEIRSLAARLYTEQCGKDFSQALLGHKHAMTTDLYRDVRGAEWIEIKAG